MIATLMFTSRWQALPPRMRYCIPPSLAAYRADPHHWDEHARLACDGEKLIPLPIGTALQIDTLERSWDPENATQYHVSAHLLDSALTPYEIQLQPGYFVKPGRDTPWGLDPAYFTAEPPAKP